MSAARRAALCWIRFTSQAFRMTQGKDQPTAPAISQPEISRPEIALDETTAPPPAAADPYLGKTIDGRYLVESILGQGGMGIVYRGRHKLIDKKVAIKVLRGDLARNKEVTDRFLQEARAASAIGNPHIIDISDFGVLPDGATYFVMEFLDGGSLSDVMEQSRPIPVPRIASIAKQMAQGLSAAHAAGIIHRDLKPDNVMLVSRGTEKDFVKILDFGIAKVQTGDASRLTRAGQVFGTPHYMSPEQAAGATVTHGTDIYSLGVMIYEMAAGKVPFDAENFMGILTMHMYKAPVPMRALVPAPQEIPPGLDAIVLKCLSKKAEQRYASMDALVSDLEKLEKGQLPEAVSEMMARSGGFNVPADYYRSPSKMPPPMPGQPSRGRGRSKIPMIAAAAAIVAVVGIAVGVLVKSNTGKADEPRADTPAATTTVPATPAAPTTSAGAATPVVEKKPIAVAVVPVDAKISLDGKELKSPVVLPLAPDEKRTVTVTRPGYVTQSVTIAGTDENRTITLVPVAGRGGRGGRGTTTGHTTKPGGGGTGILGPDPFK
jgi:serine/threonine protein kinase